MVQLFYTTYISVDLAHHEIFCAKVGQGGIKLRIALDFKTLLQTSIIWNHQLLLKNRP